MGNFKWAIIAGIAAFVISLIVGLIAPDVRFGIVILRAFIFLVVFFGVGFGITLLFSHFFPEMMVSDNDLTASDTGGRQVNIVLDSSEYAIPELYAGSSNLKEMGDIEALVSGAFKAGGQGIDANAEKEYNSRENIGFNPEQNEIGGAAKPESQPTGMPSFEGDIGMGGLIDLDAMAMTFTPGGGGSSNVGTDSDTIALQQFEESQPSKHYVGNKPQSLKGDFNPKDLAEGIRTVLGMDNK